MSTPFEQAIRRYGDVVTPHPQRFSTSPEESTEIERLKDGFIQEVLASLRLSARALSAFFTIEHRTLMEESEKGLRVSDDFDTSLWLEGVQPLASVRNVRDDPNFQVILFSKYALLPTTERALQKIYEHTAVIEGWENTP